LKHVFSGKEITSKLVQAFHESYGNRSLWYARLLMAFKIKDLDRHLLTALAHQNNQTRIGLVKLLSPKSGEKAASLLMDLAKSEQNQDLTVATLQTANRLDPEFSEMFDFEYFTNHHHPEIRAHALIGLYRREPEKYHQTIQSYLRSDALKDRQTGVIAAGGSGDKLFTDYLKEMLITQEHESMVPDLLNALYALKEAKLNDLAYPYLSHQTKNIRLAALSVLEIDNDELLSKVISIMGDASGDIFQMAQKKIETAPYQNTQLLVESLAIPNSRIRKAIFNLLESLNIKDLDVFRFARNQIRDGYQYLSDALSLKTFPENGSRNLLVDHLHQKKLQRIENILRVLALQDTSGEMKIIYRGILSSDSRKRANAMEALENMVDKRLFKEMIPLIESSSPQESLNIGRKRFQLIGLESGEKTFISHLLADTDWVTVALALDLIQNHGPEQFDYNILSELITSENKFIRRTAQKFIDKELKEGEQHDG